MNDDDVRSLDVSVSLTDPDAPAARTFPENKIHFHTSATWKRNALLFLN